jgi:uncharacterized protein YciI
MKHLILLISIILVACNTNPIESSEDEEIIKERFDSIRANKIGADLYGMKTYVIAFLKRGSTPSTDSIESARLQAAHMANINRLAKAGKLVLAGPFYGKDSLRGIYIFDTDKIDSAKKWTQSDPAIQQGSLKMDLKLWYGSAALMEVNEIHNKIAKEIF